MKALASLIVGLSLFAAPKCSARQSSPAASSTPPSSGDNHIDKMLVNSPLPVPPYYIGSFYWGSAPKDGPRSRPAWDISTSAMRDRLFTRLEQVGINMLTYAYVYRNNGSVYPNDNPKLKPQVKPWLGRNPVKDFLDECETHHMSGYLGLALVPDGLSNRRYFDYLNDITTDMVERFKKYPAFRGFVPPVESRSPNLNADEFSELAQTALRINPDMTVMDFPNGPFAEVVRTILNHIHSGRVNIENVQFYIGNFSEFSYFLSNYREMQGFRGLTDFVQGLSDRVKTIVHTHYMNGYGERAIPKDQVYRVSQGVLLTATTCGIHFFNYFDLFNGYDILTHRNAFWRWAAWCKGVLSVQRYVPYYAGSKLVAAVTTVIPRETGLGGTAFVNMAWTPLAIAHVPQAFAANLGNVHSRIWIVPSPVGLSEKQISSITRFLKDGGTLISVLDPKTNIIPNPNDDFDFKLSKYTVGNEEDQIPPDYQKLLRCDYTHYVEDTLHFLSRMSAFTREKEILANGFELNAEPRDLVLARWSDGKPAVLLRHLGKGILYIIPGDLQFLAEILPLLAREHMDMLVKIRNLPHSYTFEQYQTKGRYSHSLFLILGSKKGSSARHVELELPSSMKRRFAVYFDNNRLCAIKPVVRGGNIILRLPRIKNYGALVMSNNTFPLLHPDESSRNVLVGSRQRVSVTLFNALDATISDTLTMTLPEQWSHMTTSVREPYKLLPGEKHTFWFYLTVPKNVEHDTYFIHFTTLGLTQREMFIPVNGKPRIIMQGQVAPTPMPSRGKIGYQWIGVAAGETGKLRYSGIAYIDNNQYDHDPGVSFYYNGQWSAPQSDNGITFRTGKYSTLAGGPRFWINGVNTHANYEIRMVYKSDYHGKIQVWNGSYFKSISEIPVSQSCDTLDCVLHGGEFVNADGTGNVDALAEFCIPQISLAKIDVREVPSRAFSPTDSLRSTK